MGLVCLWDSYISRGLRWMGCSLAWLFCCVWSKQGMCTLLTVVHKNLWNTLYCTAYWQNQSCDCAYTGMVLYIDVQQQKCSAFVCLLPEHHLARYFAGMPTGKWSSWFGTCTARKLLRSAWRWCCCSWGLMEKWVLEFFSTDTPHFCC